MRSLLLSSRLPFLLVLVLLALSAACSTPTENGDGSGVVNVYSARHYDSDDIVFANFTEQTGIAVNVLEDKADALLERIDSERSEPVADVLLTVDAGRLFKAESRGFFQPLDAPEITSRVPEHLRHPEDLWVGLTKRARVIAYSNERVSPEELGSYEDLTQPRWKGRVLVRSSSNIYNQSLVGSIILAHGEQAAEEWCEGLVENLARTPQGGDRDQIRAISAGEGDVAIVNSYYYVQMAKSADEADRAVVEKVSLFFPNQDGRGTHVNLSGIGLIENAPHRGNGLRLIEFLLDEQTQELMAGGSSEFPIRTGVAVDAALEPFSDFVEDGVNAAEIGKLNAESIKIMDRVGWR